MKARICDRCFFRVPKGNWYCLTCGSTSHSEAEIVLPPPSWREKIYPAVSNYAYQLALESGEAAKKVAQTAAAGLHTIFFVDTSEQQHHH
jgi:hypothetical protein